jgi:alkylation response protein AidB-like acyl-CoA dehydrogenase
MEPGLEEFTEDAHRWLSDHAERRSDTTVSEWGCGSDDVSVFHNLTFEEEAELLAANMAWQREKFDGGWGAITWPEAAGGRGLPSPYAKAFAHAEAEYETPRHHEAFSVTIHLVAPTIAAYGTPEQQRELIPCLLRTEQIACQLFSEPSAGSDLASVRTHADRDGDGWVVNGQKVWSSGAGHASWGELICRTDPDLPKHAGLTAFLLPLDAPGVEVRPIRQMNGGSSFYEVFLTDVRVSDEHRLGAAGEGWKVALTTLGFERGGAGGGTSRAGGSWEQLVALAQWLGATGDPLVRQDLARVYSDHRLQQLTGARVSATREAGQPPGPEGSIGKLLWTRGMTRISDVVSHLLGARLTADSGEWGTFAWTQHVLGAPGYRIAGGSDEVQRNIIGERVLGLPREPRG